MLTHQRLFSIISAVLIVFCVTHSVLKTTRNLFAVTYSGLNVIVEDNGTILTSTDRTTWASRTS